MASAAGSSSSWPPSLKAFVNETFAKCTDANRAEVETELKAKILAAFQKSELWTTEWSQTQLKSLQTKKRKSGFVPSYLPPPTSSPSVPDESSRRDKRAKRFDATPFSISSSSAGGNYSRFTGYGYASGNGYTPTPEPDVDPDPNVLDWDKDTVVGTSRKLEKPYLRLTSLPDPTTIRPLPVLQQTLELLKKKWREESNYPWVCDQFKSMRQDLTVQRIKNDFTCSVYEIHARIALEQQELGEFNQCQAQLKELYKAGLKGHQMEFLGYRILYLVYSRNRSEMNALIRSLTPRELADPSVAHAIAVRAAVDEGSYTKLFRLFQSAPKMGAYVMDHFVERERVAAVGVMAKAYQAIPMKLLVSQLAFDSAADAHLFLNKYSAAHYRPLPPALALAAKFADSVTDPALEEKVLLERSVDAKMIGGVLKEALAKFVKLGEERKAGEAVVL